MNWKQTIKTLVERGQTQVGLAEHCGVAQATISDLSRGVTKSPSYELGTKLVALLEATTPKTEKASEAVRASAIAEGA